MAGPTLWAGAFRDHGFKGFQGEQRLKHPIDQAGNVLYSGEVIQQGNFQELDRGDIHQGFPTCGPRTPGTTGWDHRFFFFWLGE